MSKVSRSTAIAAATSLTAFVAFMLMPAWAEPSVKGEQDDDDNKVVVIDARRIGELKRDKGARVLTYQIVLENRVDTIADVDVTVQSSNPKLVIVDGAVHLDSVSKGRVQSVDTFAVRGNTETIKLSDLRFKIEFVASEGSEPSNASSSRLAKPTGAPVAPSSAALVLNATVGVIPQSAGACPSGSSYLWVYTDDEDNNNQNQVSGWVGATASNQGNTGTRWGFCAVDGFNFYAHPVIPYAVLKLGDVCPNGSVALRRKWDTENSNNQNNYSGSFNPPSTNVIGNSNVTLTYCAFEPTFGSACNTSATSYFPNLGVPYGVFAPNAPAWIQAHGEVYTDDEDFWNGNSYTSPSGNSHKNSDALAAYGFDQYFSGHKNTTVQIAKVRN